MSAIVSVWGSAQKWLDGTVSWLARSVLGLVTDLADLSGQIYTERHIAGRMRSKRDFASLRGCNDGFGVLSA